MQNIKKNLVRPYCTLTLCLGCPPYFPLLNKACKTRKSHLLLSQYYFLKEATEVVRKMFPMRNGSVCTTPTLHEGVIHSKRSSKSMIIPATLLPCLSLHHCRTSGRKQNLPQWSPGFLPERQLPYWRENGLEGQRRGRSSSSPSCCWHVHPHENCCNISSSVKFSWLSYWT